MAHTLLMEWLNIGQLTKEMVVARLSQLADPVDAAVEILEKTVLIALKDVERLQPGHRQTVAAACQGTLIALLLKEHNLKIAAVKILRMLSAVAQKTKTDPMELSLLALHAIADLRRFVSQQELADIRAAIDAEFMGTGDALKELLSKKQAASPAAP